MKEGGGGEANERYASVGNQVSEPIDPSDPTSMRNRGVPKECARQGYRPPSRGSTPNEMEFPPPHRTLSACIRMIQRPTTNWTDLGLAPDDGIPEVARQAHLVSGVDVSVAEYARGGIEQAVVQRQCDAPAVTHHVGGVRRRGDYLGIVILHGLLQKREGRGAVPLPPEVRQYPAIATQEEARRRGGITRGGVVVEGGRLGGGGLRERRRRRRRRRCCGGRGVGGWESYDDGQQEECQMRGEEGSHHGRFGFECDACVLGVAYSYTWRLCDFLLGVVVSIFWILSRRENICVPAK